MRSKVGEVKRNFFPPSRNSIPLVAKEVAGFYATHMAVRERRVALELQRDASKL